MPMRRHLYPDDWEAISRAIRARSGGRCECLGECGLHHGRRCDEIGGARARWAHGLVVLTVAHLNHENGDDRMDCSDGNLKAMCQRCHLRMDGPHHRRRAAATRREKRRNLELEL